MFIQQSRSWAASAIISLCAVFATDYVVAACSSRDDQLAVFQATGGDIYLTQVVCQVMTQAEALDRMGKYERVSDFGMIGRIKTNMPVAASVINLTAGRDYIFAGACDSDCTDLDIHIMDTNGDIVASDTDSDDNPMVRYSPSQSGKFAVIPKLATCSVRQCAYAVLAYEK